MKPSTPNTPTPTISPPEFGRKQLNLWTLAIVIIGILIVGILFTLIYFSTAQVYTITFSYTPQKDLEGSYNSLTISDVDGLVTVLPWSQSSILINGTITAKGLGSSVSTVIISNSSVKGDVVFNAKFPASGGFLFSQTYAVNVNVFVPSMIRFDTIKVSNANGGVQLDNVNTTKVDVTTVNGDISVDCTYCVDTTAVSTNGNVTAAFIALVDRGSYNLTATNANISFMAPSQSSFTLNVKVLNGFIICSICNAPETGQKSLTETFGGGGATVNLSSVNGQITITAT